MFERLRTLAQDAREDGGEDEVPKAYSTGGLKHWTKLTLASRISPELGALRAFVRMFLYAVTITTPTLAFGRVAVGAAAQAETVVNGAGGSVD